MALKTYAVLFLFILSACHVSGQTLLPDSTFYLSGYIMSSADSMAIPNAHILNLNKGTGTISSANGNFELLLRNHDTLKVSCIGFTDRYLFVNLSVLSPETRIFLEQDTVMMKELRISPLPPRQFFKITFLETKVPFEEIPNLQIPGIMKDPGYVPPTGLIIPKGPAQLLYDVFNKKARTNRKLKRNRNRYSKYLVPEVADSLVYPEKF